MKRLILPILLVGALVMPFALRWWKGKQSAETPDPSVPAVVIVTPHVESIRREFAQAFSEWHKREYGTPVRVDYRNYGGASSIVQFFNASKPMFEQQGTYKVDLVWGGGDFLFDTQLKKPGYLEPAGLEEAFLKEVYPEPELGGLALYDRSKEPEWFGTALSSFGIAYNRDVLRHLGVPEPKTWKDLEDPRLRGWIVMADPTLSSSAKTAFMIVVERAMADAVAQGRTADEGWAEGMGLVRKIASNARMFTDASSSIPGAIASGDVGVGMTIDFHARSTIDAVGEARMGYIEPVNATAVNPDPVAMVRGAENKELARRFIRFLLTEEAQLLWNVPAGQPGGPKQDTLRRLPIRRSVYSQMHRFADRVNPFEAVRDFNTSNERRATFGIIGELIQMSCMDVLPDLRRTRQAILASARADELDARLGRFPFDQAEALSRMKKWRESKPVARLGLQRAWTAEFRQEYRKLREEAR